MVPINCRSWLFVLVVFLPVVTTVDFIDTISMVEITRGEASGSRIDRFTVTSDNTTICTNSGAIRSEINADCIKLEQASLFCSLNCTCLPDAPSFIESEKICSHERLLKEGCPIAFGSYTFDGGWDWDDRNDQLPLLDMENGYGFMSAFNVSTSAYTSCSMTLMELYNNEGVWNVFDDPNLKVAFFKQNFMWHISLYTESLTTEKSAELEGRFARLHIKCSEEEVTNGILTSEEMSSCSIIKITGNRTYNYTIFVTSSTSILTSTRSMTSTHKVTTVGEGTTTFQQKSTSTLLPSPSSPITMISTHETTVGERTTTSLQKSSTTLLPSPTSSTITTHHSTETTIHSHTTIYPPTVITTSAPSNNTTTSNGDDIGVIIGTTLAIAFVLISITAAALLTYFSQSYKKQDLRQCLPRDSVELYNIGIYNRVQGI